MASDSEILTQDVDRADAPDFLTGGGAMSALIRAHDWSGSPLGDPEGWPQSLRAVVALMINSRYPMFVAWGSELAFLYNDGYAPIFGAKHPRMLGRPFREAWSEIWDDLSPLVESALAGESTYHEDLHLVMERHGYPEDTWYSFSYSPVRDESGAVAGMFCACTETTETVLSERRQAFRVTLTERLGDLSDPREIMAEAARLLGEQLDAGCVGYAEESGPDTQVMVEIDWTAPGAVSVVGPHRMTDYGPPFVAELLAGRTVRVDDTISDPLTRGMEAAFEAINTRAFADAPLVRDGRLAALLFVLNPTPRAWSDLDIAMIEEVAERTWAAVERARAEAARARSLAEENERTKKLFEQAPGFIAILRGPDLVFEFVNEAYNRVAGARDYVGKTVREAFPDLEPTGLWELLDQVYATGERAVVNGMKLNLQRTPGADPDELFLTFMYQPIIDEHGQTTGIFIEGHDITDAHRAQAALAESEERYRSLFGAIDAGFCLVEMKFDEDERAIDYKIVEMNPAFERQTGLQNARGKWVSEIAPDLERHWHDTYGLVALTGEPARFENHASSLLDRWFDVHAYRVGAPGDYRVAILFNDISDRRRAEQALRGLNETLEQRVSERTGELMQAQEALRQSQKLEAMGQLTGGVAHDFNNILTPIIGGLDMLQRRGLGGEREQRMIDGALQSAERAKTLVQRLLAFARRQPLQPEAVDVGTLVTGMADLVASTSGPRIRVAINVAADLPAALADPNQLEMAILNLAVNARDAMPDGGTLTVTAGTDTIGARHRSKLRPGRYVRLSVADSGAGMDAATLARAIEPFFSTKGIGKGTGLGLSMVHGLVAQLGGSLALSSKPGLGTNAELWLPASEEAAETTERAIDPVTDATARGTALLVDDEELVRMSTADMLADLGYEVMEAASAEEALSLLDGGLRIDMLVTDHLMPGMTGADLARAVQGKWPGTAVLIVSGYADAEEIAPDLPRLTKPFRQADLAASVAN